jgi:hypothetical protein
LSRDGGIGRHDPFTKYKYRHPLNFHVPLF